MKVSKPFRVNPVSEVQARGVVTQARVVGGGGCREGRGWGVAGAACVLNFRVGSVARAGEAGVLGCGGVLASAVGGVVKSQQQE